MVGLKLPELASVRQILTRDWLLAGNTGQPTRDYIRKWRRENPEYGRWPLTTRFRSGSAVAIRPEHFDRDPDEEATELPEVREKRERREAEMFAWRRERFEVAKQLGIATEYDDPDYGARRRAKEAGGFGE